MRLARRFASLYAAPDDRAYEAVEVRETRSIGRALVAVKVVHADEPVLTFRAKVAAVKSRFSVQVGRDEHTSCKDDQIFMYMNHSCKPTCRLALSLIHI